jgi:hypothetical protein
VPTHSRLCGPSFSYVLSVLVYLGLLLVASLVALLKLFDEHVAFAIWTVGAALTFAVVVFRLAKTGAYASAESLTVRTVLRTTTVLRHHARGMARKTIWYTAAAAQRVPTMLLVSGAQVKFTFMVGRSTHEIDLVVERVREWRTGSPRARSLDVDDPTANDF